MEAPKGGFLIIIIYIYYLYILYIIYILLKPPAPPSFFCKPNFVKRIFERLDFLLPLAPLVHFGAFVQFVNYARLSETVED